MSTSQAVAHRRILSHWSWGVVLFELQSVAVPLLVQIARQCFLCLGLQVHSCGSTTTPDCRQGTYLQRPQIISVKVAVQGNC